MRSIFMDERIKTILAEANENYNSAMEITSNVISKNPLCTITDKLLAALIQAEVTNGCLIAETLSLLNTPKEGDME
jgi:hypothetical protein